jgi:hypothetical protein
MLLSAMKMNSTWQYQHGLPFCIEHRRKRTMTTTEQVQGLVSNEVLMIGLDELDDNEIAALPYQIAEVAQANKALAEDALVNLVLANAEQEHRQAGKGSTNEYIDSRFVSVRSLRDLYYAELRHDEETTLVYPEDINDAQAMAEYRGKLNALAEASREWLIYRVLEERGAAPDLYLPEQSGEKIS